MKKRTYLIVFSLLLLMVVPVVAAPLQTSSAAYSKYALGLNLGTNTGLGFQVRANRDFDIIGNLGLNNFDASQLSFDVAANYKINEFSIDRADFDVTMGLGVNVGVPLNDTNGFDFSVLVPFGVVYHFTEVPIDVYFRLAPGIQIVKNDEVGVGLGFSGFLGGLWRFD
ncbi:MAG TPA: hypothetical protein DCG32_11165 [Sphaerochaeta sp.]|jgi:hypothetical protein|nr:hypothetical protein [Sphaerochaeta sp.]